MNATSIATTRGGDDAQIANQRTKWPISLSAPPL